MENATHALMMAFAVLIFVTALTISMVSLNSVKRVSDAILYTKDETNYYTYTDVKGKAAENRIVGLETIIPTLYKYYKENYTVVFRQANYNKETGDFVSGTMEYLPVYKVPSTRNWESSYKDLMEKKYGNRNGIEYKEKKTLSDGEIFSFDIDEETLRHEPWTGSEDKVQENIRCFLNGTIYNNPNNNLKYKDYSESPLQPGGFIGTYGNSKFVETIEEYNYKSSQATDSTIGSLTKEKLKRMIVFTRILE